MSRSAVELGCGARLPHSAKLQTLMFFEDVIGLYLAILEKVKAAQDRSGWDVVVEQSRQDFLGEPLLQLGGHDPAALHGVVGSCTCSIEPGIVNEILSIQRLAHA